MVAPKKINAEQLKVFTNRIKAVSWLYRCAIVNN